MELKYQLFLEALKASLENKKVSWDFDIPLEIWQDIFYLAEVHKVVPLIFEAVYACPAAQNAEKDFFACIKRRSIQGMVVQIQKTTAFLKLYQYLQNQGLSPLVVKGMICRQLYPVPDLRLSSDEDLLVPEGQFIEFVAALQAYEMEIRKEPVEIASADEIGFLSKDGVSYIELHKHLFSKESEAYGQFNNYFKDVFSDNAEIEIQGTKIKTIEPAKNLFYLICHALKHFLHSGFGIRQLCDIVMFANTYGKQIDWMEMLEKCREIHADQFVAALFKIGRKHLNFDEEKAGYPKEWQEIDVDENNLLIELMGSGLYGDATMSRKHSSNMTLEAVAERNKGKKGSNHVIKTLFPTVKKLEGNYHYLHKRPYLLPIAWSERLLKYHMETRRMKDSDALEAVKIGNQRIELFKQYGLLEK